MSVYDGTVSPTRVETPSGTMVIGAIDRINGAGAEPSGFVVTKHELERVARYWFHERPDNYYTCFIFQSSGSSPNPRAPGRGGLTKNGEDHMDN